MIWNRSSVKIRTKSLEGKKVLVVHPFEKSIIKQYKRDKIFYNGFLPQFELITLKSVQSLGGITQFIDWFQALDYMKNKISEIDFDIALKVLVYMGCR